MYVTGEIMVGVVNVVVESGVAYGLDGDRKEGDGEEGRRGVGG